MERMTIVRMGWLVGAAAAAALSACTGAGSPEAEAPDSAMVQVPADPAAAPQPIQAESLTNAPTRTRSGATPAQPATTTPARPPLRQPPEARDIRPSIPYPPDTLSR